MSDLKSSYVSKSVDAQGFAVYTQEENEVWHELYQRQTLILPGRACDEYLQGLKQLALPKNRVPQCPEVSKVLQKATGWSLEPVPALISFDRFFALLADRRFPAATFIRRKEELDYLKEPDVFHEIFGHCPMLTNPAAAEFTHTYGKLGLKASSEERILLARLFWFTVEFGLIQTPKGLRAYGGGILSSIGETVYCVESPIPERRPFDVMQALRTAYRIDIMQPIYYVLKSFDQLYQLVELDLMGMIREVHHEHPAPAHPC